MSRLQPSFVLGYHGCDEEVGEKILRGEPMIASAERYDWLGGGIYFWEADPVRAREWAEWKAGKGDYKKAFVIGAVIDLGNCLDATTREGAEAIDVAYGSLIDDLTVAGAPRPKNVKAKRYLDCAVINRLHDIVKKAGEPPYETVRALFPQGRKIYRTSGFWQQTHIQIAVINPGNIKGTFRVKA